MAYTIPLVSPHTTGILSALSTVGFPVGDGKAPVDTDPPYAILYLAYGPPPEGPLSDWQADLTLIYQITSVGVTDEQARLVADLCAAKMVKDNITITGRTVMYIQNDGYDGSVREERSIPNPLFSQQTRYVIKTTPT